ncbi:MAG: hypothetical protein DMF51_17160 [Acidobacteria bacterium]|nr:MAG: hypothetical protein DMF51_17160 [Acidobacteriota bacterium]
MTRRHEGTHRFLTAIAAALATAALAISGARADEPKPVTVVNTPTVQAQQSGPWTVMVQGGLSLAPGNLVGIDPAQNMVRLVGLPALQPYQTSTSLFIDYPDDTWQSTLAVPAGKVLIIEYVSGSFTKKIGGGSDPTQPPFLFTVTTTAGGQSVAHVVPVRGVFDYAGTESWFQIAEPLRLYAATGTSVAVKLQHLFSAGYQIAGSISLSGQLQDAP